MSQIRIEYLKYVNYVLHLRTNGKRKLMGEFKQKDSGEILKEEFDCLNCNNDAKKSYQATLDWFNHTRTEEESFRILVSAKWTGEQRLRGLLK